MARTHSPISTALALGVSVPALIFLAWAYLSFMHAPAVGTFHDDGVYLVTAKALATGQGYRIVSLPGEPRQTKYPILFPWLLSVVWRAAPAFPRSLPWLRLVPFTAAIVWLGLSYVVVRRLGASSWIAAAAVLLTAVSPWALYLSTTLLSETLFAALMIAAILVLMSAGAARVAGGLGAGGLMGAAVLTRTAAVAPAAAVFVMLAARRRWSALAAYAAAVAAISGPWFWWAARHTGEAIVDAFYSGSNYASWNVVFNYAWRDKLAIVGVNAFWATEFGQFWGLPLGTRLAWTAAALCSALVLRGLWVQRTSAAALVCVFYMALLLAWAFPPIRFMVPILPLLVWFMFAGAGRFRPAVGVLVAALALCSGAAMRRQVDATLEQGGTWFDASLVDDWRAMRGQYDWISRNAAREAVVIATHDPTVYLFTGRKALRPSTMDPIRLYYNVRGVRFDPSADAETFRQRVLDVRADYVVVTPRDDRSMLRSFQGQFPRALSAVQGDPRSYAIYSVNRSALLRN